MKVFSRREICNQILYLCIATDIAFIGLNVLYEMSAVVNDAALKITEDRGYAEVFQYIKEFWIAGLLLTLALRTYSLLYFAWSLLFSYVLLDDALRIHETLSKVIRFPSLLGLNRRASGEIIIFGVIGLCFLILVAVTYRLGSPLARSASRFLAVMVLALGFTGVFIDGLHIVVQVELLDPIFTILEDGGEMIIMSLTLSFVLLLSAKTLAKRKPS